MHNQHESPLVSVIVPVYNKEDYISETLDSVISQSLRNIEIIVIDDGSTDGSLSLCKQYAAKDVRIRVISQQNQGVISARNAAIATARAPFIFPLDSDDLIAPECLEKLYTEMQDPNPPSVAYAQTVLFGARNEPYELPTVSVPDILFRNCVVCSALYRKSDWEKYGGYKENMRGGYEDWDFWLSFIAEGKRFLRLNETLFYYRILPASRNSIPKSRKCEIYKALIDNHPELYHEHEPSFITRLTYPLWRLLKFLPAIKKEARRVAFFLSAERS